MKYYPNLYMLTINIKQSDAIAATPPGDNEQAIKQLREKPSIKKQLAKLDPEKVRLELEEYGAWDNEQLADDNENLSRFLWSACCEIQENYFSNLKF